MPYPTIQYHTAQYHITKYHTAQYHTAQYNMVQYRLTQSHTTQHRPPEMFRTTQLVCAMNRRGIWTKQWKSCPRYTFSIFHRILARLNITQR